MQQHPNGGDIQPPPTSTRTRHQMTSQQSSGFRVTQKSDARLHPYGGDIQPPPISTRTHHQMTSRHSSGFRATQKSDARLHPYGGDIQPHPTSTRTHHQMTSQHSTGFRVTQKSDSNTTYHCLPLPDEPEGSPGSSTCNTNKCSLPGNQRCGGSRHKTCPAIWTTDEFTSHRTGQHYIPKAKASCKSVNVIYQIQCKRYGRDRTGTPLQNE